MGIVFTISQDSSSANRGSASCWQIGSKASSSVLRKMFATTSTIQKCPILFDPTADCVCEQQKKKAARNNISIMVVHNIQDGVPKAANKLKRGEWLRLTLQDKCNQVKWEQCSWMLLKASISKHIKFLTLLGRNWLSLRINILMVTLWLKTQAKGNMLYVMDSTLLGVRSWWRIVIVNASSVLPSIHVLKACRPYKPLVLSFLWCGKERGPEVWYDHKPHPIHALPSYLVSCTQWL